MSRWVIWAIGIAGSFVIVGAAAGVFLQRAACRAATENGKLKDFRQFNAKQLDLDVRSRVPLGSSRTTVERFLQAEGMKFGYDSSVNAIFANAPCIKGSGIILQSLNFDFRFGSDSKLISIESRVHLTGP